MDLKKYVIEIADFPKKGVSFKDVTPLVLDGIAYQYSVEQIAAFGKERGAELVAGPESRGFLFGCPVATKMGLGFIPFRKPNKLPRKTQSVKYGLEYGNDELQIHVDDIKPGVKVFIVDDLLASGGTLEACIKLLEDLGAIIVGVCFVIEITSLNGRERFAKYDVHSLIKYKE